jgi:hypothetical protein
VDNIKMNLKEIDWDGVDWIEGSCEHGNQHSGSITFWEILEKLHNLQLLKES